MMLIIQKYLSLGKPARSGKKFTVKPDTIIIHWIGSYPNQTVYDPWNWWENGNAKTGLLDGTGIEASAHIILKDEKILQALPFGEVGWHSGDSRNYNSIGIEVIPMNNEGEFSKQSIDTLRLLIAAIKKEIGQDMKLERHYDGVQKKGCPLFYTPLSEVITKEEQHNNIETNGEERWEYLKLFLNDWDRTSPNAA
jgi:hypothetical protein